MQTSSLQSHVKQVCDMIDNLCSDSDTDRIVIGIAGPPASGKSTLAEAVVAELNQNVGSDVPKAALLPMDGFHLDNPILEARGLMARKGAPETFNAHGFCEAVRQLSSASWELYLPRFDRQLDLAIANAITIHSETSVVIVEGNYLLLGSEPWSTLSDLFSATVFVNPDIEVLRDRLVERWLAFGLDPEAALARATGNDLVNAELIIRDSSTADLTLSENYTGPGD